MMYCINTRNKHNSVTPTSKVPCFHKSTYCARIKVFNNLPRRFTSWMKEKAQFKAELWRYLNMHYFYSVEELLMLKNDAILSSDVCMNLVLL